MVREDLALENISFLKTLKDDIDTWDPRLGLDNESLMPTEGYFPHQVTKIDTSIFEEEECVLVDLLIRNINLFSRDPSGMLGIDTRVVFHHLSINPPVKPVSQRK